MKIAICGPSRCGKDTAANAIVEATKGKLRFAFSTSWVIALEKYRELGYESPEAAFARRHDDRDKWYQLGNEMRVDDPAYLARKTLVDGDICAGIRDKRELRTLIHENVIELVIWVHRNVPVDPTLKYGPDVADVIINNLGDESEFVHKVTRLTRTWKLT